MANRVANRVENRVPNRASNRASFSVPFRKFSRRSAREPARTPWARSAGWLRRLGLGVALASALVPLPAAAGGDGVDAPASDNPAVLGVDISHYSGTIDWPTLASSDYAFVYIKASEGVDAPDPSFADSWRAAAGTSLARGAYHFFVTEDPAAEQAELFFATVGELGPDDLVPVVDVELIGRGTKDGWLDQLHLFLELVEKRYGAKPMIYTGPNFWNAHGDTSLGDHLLWLAQYDVDRPDPPQGWDSWTVWQYAENQSVPGIEKDVDPDRLAPGLEIDDLTLGHLAPGRFAPGQSTRDAAESYDHDHPGHDDEDQDQDGDSP